MSTSKLTRAVASGDPEALARLYEREFDFLYREAHRATGRDESFCLDVVHDTMLRVIRSIPVLEDTASLRAWLRRVVRSCAVDRLRSDARRAGRESAAPRGERPDVHRDDDRAWLGRELAALGPALVDMLRQRFHLGWTLARIGEATGLTPGAVDGRITRALDSLRERGKETFDDTR